MLVVLEAQLVLLVDVLDATGRPLGEGILAAGGDEAGLVAARGHLEVGRGSLKVDYALIIICSR